MFTSILKPIDNEDDIMEEETSIDEKMGKQPITSLNQKKGVIKTKIKFLTKMLKMQKVLREENENIISIKALNNDKLPQGLLLEGKMAIQEFKRIKYLDLQNEKRPY